MMSIQKTARLAGFLYLLLAVISAFGLVYIPTTLILPGDTAATINNIQSNEGLFRLGIVSNLIAFTINIFLVILLFKILKPVNKGIASLMVILILMGLTIAIINEVNQVAVLLLSSADYLNIFTAKQSQGLASLFLDMYQHGFIIGHIFFGLWLFPMGYLIFKSQFLPRFLGAFLIIAGFGYLADFFLFFLFPNFNIKISEFTFVGEVFLLLWLLIKGVNVKKWEELNVKSHNK